MHSPLSPGSWEPCTVGRTLAHLRVPPLLPGGAALCATCRKCARREKAVPARLNEQPEKRGSLRDNMAPSVVLRSFSRLLAPARLPSCCECLFRPHSALSLLSSNTSHPGISGGGGRGPDRPAVTFTVHEPGSPLFSRQLSSRLTPDLCEWILSLFVPGFSMSGKQQTGRPFRAASSLPLQSL